MKRISLTLLGVLTVLALSLAACGGGEKPAEEAPPQEAEPEEVEAEPTETEEATPAGVEFVLANDSSADICHLYLSPADQGAWGADQLGGETVRAGEEFTISGMQPGTYNLRFESCEGVFSEEYGLDITGASVEYTLTGVEGGPGVEETETVNLNVMNGSPADICHLYLSPPEEETWGPDQLGGVIIQSGKGLTLENIEPGTYDVRYESCDGESLEQYGLDLTQSIAITLGE